jgi:hypothetical protein
MKRSLEGVYLPTNHQPLEWSRPDIYRQERRRIYGFISDIRRETYPLKRQVDEKRLAELGKIHGTGQTNEFRQANLYYPEVVRYTDAQDALFQRFAPQASTIFYKALYSDKTEIGDSISPNEYISPEDHQKAGQELARDLRGLVKVSHICTDLIIEFRRKGIFSTWAKMIEQTLRLDEVLDKIAVRIYVAKEEEAYLILNKIGERFKPVLPNMLDHHENKQVIPLRDWLARPKKTGYAAINSNHIFYHNIGEKYDKTFGGKRAFEVQIMTMEAARRLLLSREEYKAQ